MRKDLNLYCIKNHNYNTQTFCTFFRMLRFGIRATPSRLVLMRTKYSTVFETEDASKRWRAVEDILPPIQIPTPNLNQPFPTPSGIYLFLTLTYRLLFCFLLLCA